MDSDLGTFGTGSCSCDYIYECAPDVYRKQFRTAAKEHRCCECGDKIPKGQRYEYVTALYDGSWSVFKTCLPCAALAMDLGCRMHEGLVDQFFDRFNWDYREDPADWDDEEDE